MSVQNVSGISTVGTKGLPKAQTQNVEQPIQTEKKGGKKKIMLALGALAAVGIAGVAIAKGKKAPLETINLDKFKEIGTFNKGVASIDGKPFTGIINTSNKNGVFALEYKKGILKQSTKYLDQTIDLDSQGCLKTQLEPVLKKIYSLNKNGTKTIETLTTYNNGEKWVRKGLTTISDSQITKETLQGTELLQKKIFEKQTDGSWKGHFETDILTPDWL